MIHILASVPFWVIGLLCGAMGLLGAVRFVIATFFEDVSDHQKIGNAFVGSVLFLVVSGLSLWLAAWLCS